MTLLNPPAAGVSFRSKAGRQAAASHRRLLPGDAATGAVLAAVFIYGLMTNAILTTTNLLNFGLFTLLVASMQLMHGFTNQASLTQAGMYGVGAYTAVWAEVHLGFPPMAAFAASALSGLLPGLLFALPLIRLREHFLAMGTLAAQIILTQTFTHLNGLTGGINGEVAPDARLNSMGILAVILAFDFAVLVGLSHLRVSRHGRQLLALKTDETMAASVGVHVARLRVIAVGASFGLAAAAGCLFTETAAFISPDDFTLTTSLAVLVAVILGGRSLTWGTLVGAGAYSLLNAETIALPGLSALILGIVLVVVLGYLPQGLTGLRLPATWLQRGAGGRRWRTIKPTAAKADGSGGARERG